MRFTPTRLATKLNVSLLLFMLLLGAAVAGLVLFGFRRSERNATRQSRQGLEQQSRDVLQSSARLNASIAQSQFSAASGIGQEAAHYMVDVKTRGGTIPWDSSRLVVGSEGQLYDPDPRRRTDVRVPTGVSPAIAERDLRDSATLDAFFPTLLANFGASAGDANFSPASIYFRSVNNVTRYYPVVGAGSRQLAASDEPPIPAGLDPQSNPDRLTVWSAPHEGIISSGPVITSFSPVYEGDEFRGIIGVDISLQRLIEQINGSRVSANGFAFYMADDGSILRSGRYATIQAALDDPAGGLARTVAAMRRGESSVDRVAVDGEDAFVAYAPLNGVGGSLALVAPVADLTAQAAAVDTAIRHEANRTLIFTLASMGAFLVAALAGGALTYRRLLLQPISRLVKGTHAVTEGDLRVRLPVGSADELGMLADSFNRMTQQLEQRRDALREEIAERERTSEALAEREAQQRTVFEATRDGLIITELDGKVVEVNPAACAMHGYTRDEFLALPALTHIDPEFHERRREMVEQLNSGGEFRARSRNVRKDGTSFPTEVLGTIIAYRGQAHVLAVSRDITDQVEAERILEQRVAARTNELATLLEVTRNVASMLELRPLLGVILEQVKSVVSYDLATFLLREGEELRVLAVNTMNPSDVDELMRVRIPIIPGDMLWETLSRGEAVNLPSLAEDSPIAESTRAGMRGRIGPVRTRVRSWLGVPLRSKERLIGMLAITSEQIGFFNDADVQLATAIASQAAFAVENASLFEQEAERSHELATLVGAARDVASTIELQPLLRIILEQVRKVAPYDRASFMLREDNLLSVVATDLPASDDAAAHQRLRFRIDVPGTLWEILNRGEPVIIEDIQGESELAHAYRQAVGRLRTTLLSANRSWLGVPLVLQDRVIAVLALSRETPGFYTPRHAQLATSVAGQAAFAVENARLFEREEERTRELTTLLDVAAHVGSTLELQPLAQRILEETAVVVPYDRATFTLVDNTELSVAAVHAARTEADESLLEQVGERYPLGGPELIWNPLLAGKPVIVDDTHGDTPVAEQYRQAVGPRHVARSRGRNWMAIPLMLHGELKGVILMTKLVPGFFTRRHSDLAMAIASQAAVGIENARLYEQTQLRTRELTTVLDVSHAVASTLKLEKLFKIILDQLENVTRYSGASLLVMDGDDLVIVESRGLGRREDEAIGMRFPTTPESGWWGLIRRDGAMLIDDVRENTEYGAMYRDALGAYLELPAFSYVRSWLGVSLMHQGKVVGMLSMSNAEPAQFSEQHVRLAAAIAEQAALAIENARLYERVQTTAALEERQRLARELHDSVSQALYGIGLGARTAQTVLERDPARAKEPIEYVLSLAEAGLAEMRALIFELRPESLESEGLVAALDKQISATRARYSLPVEAQLGPEPEAPLDVKEAIYRIAQEALHNTVKHAHATRVELALACHNGSVQLDVRDDGSGFDAGGDFPGHLGLKSMRERVLRVRGTLEISSVPGHGTHIRARIPAHGPPG